MDNGNGKPTPSTTVQMVIVFDQLTGQVNVNGPIQNPLLCYGMMELAKDAIRSFNARRAEDKRIEIPQVRIA